MLMHTWSSEEEEKNPPQSSSSYGGVADAMTGQSCPPFFPQRQDCAPSTMLPPLPPPQKLFCLFSRKILTFFKHIYRKQAPISLLVLTYV